MKSIEERADAYVGHPEEIDEFTSETLKRDAYIRGAKEQKSIDINKACEIVRNIANEYFGDWEQSCKVEDTFRKSMEE